MHSYPARLENSLVWAIVYFCFLRKGAAIALASLDEQLSPSLSKKYQNLISWSKLFSKSDTIALDKKDLWIADHVYLSKKNHIFGVCL